MKSIGGREIAEFAGIAAIVASLIFVGLQLRQDEDIAAAQVWSASEQSVIELSGLIAENRELWVQGLMGEELSDTDQAAFGSIALSVLRRHLFIAQRIERLRYGGTVEGRLKVLAFQLYQYPGLRRTFDDMEIASEMQRSAFGESITGSGYGVEVRKALAELDQSSPPVPEPTYTPF